MRDPLLIPRNWLILFFFYYQVVRAKRGASLLRDETNAEMECNGDTYKNFLQCGDGLIRDRDSIYFSDFVPNVERGLPMDHSTMHNSSYDAFSILVHFERDTLE